MADEIMEAIQMLRFGYDGIKLGLDVTGSSIREAKNLYHIHSGTIKSRKRHRERQALGKCLRTAEIFRYCR